MAVFLHAAGFHCLTFDVRGHGANPPEVLPISAGEFGHDAAAAFDALMARPEVTIGAIVGHSLGAIGALLAGAADPRVAAVVATSSPSDPYRLTRQTFRLAHLPIPSLIAQPLARLTTLVYLRPRGHRVPDISASNAIARYDGPVLLAHGDHDSIVPIGHLARLARVGRGSRARDRRKGAVETLIVAGGQHSWLYEDPGHRRTVARMLTRSLGGPLDPESAGEIAAATRAIRIPDAETPFTAVDGRRSTVQALSRVANHGGTSYPATQPPGPEAAPEARVPVAAEG